ncbi:MAG: hypothetical protein ABI787_03600 [Spartobacteria bacterium]
MKKKLLVSMLLALSTGLAFAQGQAELSTTTTTTTATGEVTTTLPKPRPPAAAPIVPIEGVAQAIIRHGQPLQMINPAAPARYGNAQDRVSHDPNDPGKPKGIVLFAWTF